MTAPPRKTAAKPVAKKTAPAKATKPAAKSTESSGFAGRQAEEYTPPITAEPVGGPIPTWTPDAEDDKSTDGD